MNTNHTPGPWNRKSIPGHLFEIHNDAGESVMKIRGGMMPALADAKLIAAAPALLEACKAVYEMMHDEPIDLAIIGEILHQAIAKAS